MYHYHKRKARSMKTYESGAYYNKFQKGEEYLDKYLAIEYNQLLINIQDVLQILYTGTNDLTVVKCMREMIDGRFETLISFSCYLSAERCNEWSSMLQRCQQSILGCIDSYIDYTHDYKESETE